MNTPQPEITPLFNKSGITVAQLKEWVKSLPETNPENGEDYGIWINGTGTEKGISNPCKSILGLNEGDIIFEI